MAMAADAEEPRRDDEERQEGAEQYRVLHGRGQLYSVSGMLDPTGNFYLP